MTTGPAAGDVEIADVRRFWTQAETVHAVTYFSPEARGAADDAGFRGFWMGYFGFRAAPLGPASAALVGATFYNFHPSRVARALPDAWAHVSPDEAIEARARSAAAALRRSCPDIDEVAGRHADRLQSAVAYGDPSGRPLFAVNQALEQRHDPVERLWQLLTAAREHRGDGHVALLRATDLDGCACHVVQAAAAGVDGALYRDSRGWSEEDWHRATGRLTRRGLLGPDGLTDGGREVLAEVETKTDLLASALFEGSDPVWWDDLVGDLTRVADDVRNAGDIVFPNPMGLPPS